jgi:hypothetical protein
MKTRRGSSLWPSTLSGAAMVNQYKPGDIVTSSLVRQSDFIGVVRGVDPKINKVFVAWAGGVVCQHDPDEIHFEPHQSETVKSRMASRRPFADRTAATHQEISKGVHPSRPCKAGDLFHSGRGLQCGNCGAYTEDHGKTWEMAPEGKSRRSAADPVTDPQFVGDPAAHGMDKPIGGGFSIMQNLVKDQRQEMHEESKGGNPKMATLRSRRAMYWSNPDRIYRLTKREIVDSSALCPRCRVEMSLEPYTKNDRMYCCSKCKFKIPKSNVIVASLKSRRSAVSAS